MENENKIHEISASMVTVEVTDVKTGVVHRRDLPLDYYETANCLKLRGEALDGSPVEIVFYSTRGVERFKNISGGGPDEDACGNHT
jgi:hypothetical protein